MYRFAGSLILVGDVVSCVAYNVHFFDLYVHLHTVTN